MTNVNILIDDRTDFDVNPANDGKIVWIVTKDSSFEMCVSREQAETLYQLLGQALMDKDASKLELEEIAYRERLRKSLSEAKWEK